MLRIHLFGPLRLSYNGEAYPFAALPKALPLFAYLLLHRDAPIQRMALAYTLWPDASEETARNNLRRHLYELRRVLPSAPGDTPWLLADSAAVQWNRSAPYWLDVEQFELLCGDPVQAVQAAALYAAELLPEVHEDWLVAQRERLRSALLEVLARSIHAQRSRGNLAAALDATVELLRHDPLREDIVRDVMSMRAECGDWTGALLEYRQFEQRLRVLLNTAPTVETSALHDAIARQMLAQRATGTAPERPAADELPARRLPSLEEDDAEGPLHNLPAQLTSFFGRREEIDAITERLCNDRDRVRLLTLTGPGGSGKTRLALEVGARLLQAEPPPFPGGILAVMLAPLADPAFILPEIGKVLGVHEQPDRSYFDLLVQHLNHRRVLLILDNFEHLEAGAPVVADLLAAAGELSVLATSRAALRLYGETEFPVPPLPLPEPDLYDRPEQLQCFAAVNLLLARMHAVNPKAMLTRENAPAVAELCVRLDGLPLALELAAARSKLFTPQALLARLHDKLSFFADTRLPERQRTLRATLDWSHALLAPAEQLLFRRLSVFTGGCTPDAVDAVCADDALNAADAFDALGSLLDKSLITVQMELDHVRYTMLETIRAYAAEQLEAAAEVNELHARHFAYVLDLAGRIGARLMENNSLTAEIEELNREQDNLRAALEWGLAHDPGGALRLAGSLWPYWNLSDRADEGERWLAAALARRPSDAPAVDLARAHAGMGTMLWRKARFSDAEVQHARSLAAYRQAGDTHGEALALNNLGVQLWLQGQREQGIRIFEEGLALARTLDKPQVRLFLLTNLGLSLMEAGELEAAERHISAALATAKQQDDRYVLATILNNSAEIAFRRQEYALAQMRFQESRAHFAALDSAFGAAVSDVGEGATHLMLGDIQAAIVLFQHAVHHFFRLGDTRYIIECLEWLALAMSRTARPEQAARLLGKANHLRGETNFQGRIGLRREESAALMAELEITLGTPALAAASAQGEQMTVAAIVEIARSL